MTDLYQLGLPTVTQSIVEPYQATNYNLLGATTTPVTQAYPSTTYIVLGATSSVTEAYTATSYQTQVQTYPQVGIQLSIGFEGSDLDQFQVIGYGTQILHKNNKFKLNLKLSMKLYPIKE